MARKPKDRPKRGPGSEWVARIPAAIRAKLDAALDDDGPGRRRSVKAIYEDLRLDDYDVSLRAIQGYGTLRRQRRDNAAVGSLVRSMVGGETLTLDDIQAIAMGRLAEILQSGKLKGYELSQIVGVLDRKDRTAVIKEVDRRRKVDWEEQREKVRQAKAAVETIGKSDRLRPETLTKIKAIFGIFEDDGNSADHAGGAGDDN